MSDISDIETFLATYSGEVKDIPPDQFIPYLQVLTDGLIESIKLEHSTAGNHQFASGNIGDRPTASTAKWYVSENETGGPKLYWSNGTDWYNMTDINASNLPFAHASFPALTKISLALSYVLGAMRSDGNYVLGSKVITAPTSPIVLATEATLNAQLTTIDERLRAMDPTKMQVAWGAASKTLQQAIASTYAQLSVLANTTGAANIGMEYDSSFRHLQATDTTVWAAIKRLDEKVYQEGVDTTTVSFTHTPQGSKYFGTAAATALSAILNTIEDALTRLPIAHVLCGSWLDDIDSANEGVGNNALMDIIQFPEDPSTAGLGTAGVDNVYLDHFAARIIDANSFTGDNVYIDFRKNGATPAAISIAIAPGSTYGQDRSNTILLDNDEDYVTVHGYLGTSHTTGDPANFGWSARMVIHRNVGDLVS